MTGAARARRSAARFLCIVLSVICASAPVMAQQPDPLEPRTRLIISDRAIAMALEQNPPPAAPSQPRDSLDNGTLIGGTIGAIAAVALAVWVDRSVLSDFGDDDTCWKCYGVLGGIGFLIGAGAGAGIDALVGRDYRGMPPGASGRLRR